MQRKCTGLLTFSGFYLAMLGPVMAQQSLGDLASNFSTTTLGPWADLLGSTAFFGGLLCVIIGIVKLVSNSRNPHQQHSPMSMLIWFLAGALLIGLPAWAGVGVTSFLGSGADTSTIDGTLRSIN